MAIANVLRAHRTTELWHYTLLVNLPSIIESGAIYCRNELERRGSIFSSAHYYGEQEKREVLGEYVSCAHLPAWGMMQDEREELVVMALDVTVASRYGTCFCPGYAARAEYAAADIVTWTEDDHLERLYTGPTSTTTVRGAEIFIPNAIPADLIKRICFFSTASKDANYEGLVDAARRSTHPYRHRIDLSVERRRFPRQWSEFGAPWDGADEEVGQ